MAGNRLRKRDRLFERHRRSGSLLALPCFLSEHQHELAFEVAFELVVCSGIRIYHHVGVTVELGDGAMEPRGAVGFGRVGRESDARQGLGDVP